MLGNRRLRVFAGPNGSGKSTLFEEFKKKYNPGYFVNADELEKKLSANGFINLSDAGLEATEKELELFKKSAGAQTLIQKAELEGRIIDIQVKDNFIVNRAKETHSYEAAFLAAFIRHLMFKHNKSFSFESVMSHPSKLEEIRKANNKGYKTYLYFVCTDDPEINTSRVENRVEKGGHPVSPEKIIHRYELALNNLAEAVKCSYRAYLFDNSGKTLELIAEVFEGNALLLHSSVLPGWFSSRVLKIFIPLNDSLN